MTESLAHDKQLIGLYVTAQSARKTYHGVVLPPRPGSRSGRFRLALDDGRIVPLHPAWTVQPHPSLARDRRGKILALMQRVAGRPSYRHSDLPARHLATKTMLRREHRAQPAAHQKPIGWYRLPRDWAPLYAIADAENMSPLPANRSAAWHAARTCSRCGDEHGSPLERSPEPERDRYCVRCHQLAAAERWIEQVRPMQAAMAQWARDALADPLTVLAATENEGVYGKPYHVETVGAGVLLSATVRSFDQAGKPRSPEEFAKSTYVGDLVEPILDLGARRIIGWYGGELTYLPSGIYRLLDDDTHVPQLGGASGDALGERYRLWCGIAPGYRNGFWYEEPKLPWRWGSDSEHERGYRTAQTAKDRARWTRIYLHRMATDQPPEPTMRGASA